jgi:hypothetical protein
MNADLRTIGQKVVNEFGFMGREIISDDVDLASEGLGGHYTGKKIDKLSAGTALSRPGGGRRLTQKNHEAT